MLDKIAIKMVDGIDDALAGKAEKVHTHTIEQVSGEIPATQLPYAADATRGAVRLAFNSDEAILYIADKD